LVQAPRTHTCTDRHTGAYAETHEHTNIPIKDTFNDASLDMHLKETYYHLKETYYLDTHLKETY